MKKILMVLTVLLILAGCSSNTNNIMAGYDVPAENQFVRPEGSDETAQFEAIMQMIENREPGVYYFGFKDCPWCKHLVPVLNDALAENDAVAYYVDTRSEKAFQAILARYEAFETSIPEAQRSGGKVPYTIFIDKNGEVVGHVGTLESDDAQDDLTPEEVDFLQTRLSQNIKATK